MDALLEIKNLIIEYVTEKETIHAVNGLNLSLAHGETLGLVGETGAGKTTTALGVLNLIPTPPGRVVSGEILFDGENLIGKPRREISKIRGDKISMIFQDPMTSLNPVMTVGDQIMEVIRLHEKTSRVEAARKAHQMLKMVGIQPQRYDEYPHQFSGGMKQRVIIAIAIACNPQLLIADEPTTALDVTIQAQVLELMGNLKRDLGTSMILITHDLGIVAEVCDKAAIMYAGEIVEWGTLVEIFENAQHPYTKGLFGSLPNLEENVSRLNAIEGLMPDPSDLPKGCKFHTRCPEKTPQCESVIPETILLNGNHSVKCLLYTKGVGGRSNGNIT